MLRRRGAPGEHEPRAGNTARFGLPPEIDRYGGIIFEQPKNAVLDLLEKTHPDVEHFGENLMVIVQTAEDEAIFRQTRLASRGKARGNEPLAVVALIGFGEIDHLLTV